MNIDGVLVDKYFDCKDLSEAVKISHCMLKMRELQFSYNENSIDTFLEQSDQGLRGSMMCLQFNSKELIFEFIGIEMNEFKIYDEDKSNFTYDLGMFEKALILISLNVDCEVYQMFIDIMLDETQDEYYVINGKEVMKLVMEYRI